MGLPTPKQSQSTGVPVASGDGDGRKESGAGAPKHGRAGQKVFSFFLSAQWRNQVSQLGSHIARRSVLGAVDLAERLHVPRVEEVEPWGVTQRRESRGRN